MKKWLLISLLAAMTGALRAQSLDGTWTGKLDLGLQKLTIVLHVEGKNVTMDSPDQGAEGIPMVVDYMKGDSLRVGIRELQLSYAGALRDSLLRGTFTQAGMAFPLDLKAGETMVNRPQTPQPPYPYASEDVMVWTRTNALMSGTLFMPNGFERGKTPIVLLLTGSGSQDRDETILGHKPFLVIADHLARNGIASLRMDDRGVGKSTMGDTGKLTTVDFANDAEDAIRQLRKTKKFGRIGLLGHSEGATIAFMLGARGEADFIVSMAGCGVKGDTALAAQVNRIMELMQQPQRMTAQQYADQPAVQDNPWLRAFVAYDPTRDLKATRCPVLAINGTKDVQVISSLNLPAIEQKLPANLQSRFKTYDGLNHLFQHCQTGLVAEYGQIEETISEEVLEDIITWIGSLK